MTRRQRRFFRMSRDSIILSVGIMGIIHETFFAAEPREVLVWLFGGFVLGVPLLHQGDRAKDELERPPEER